MPRIYISINHFKSLWQKKTKKSITDEQQEEENSSSTPECTNLGFCNNKLFSSFKYYTKMRKNGEILLNKSRENLQEANKHCKRGVNTGVFFACRWC